MGSNRSTLHRQLHRRACRMRQQRLPMLVTAGESMVSLAAARHVLAVALSQPCAALADNWPINKNRSWRMKRHVPAH